MICLLHWGMMVLHIVLWNNRSGRPKDAANAENIQIINDMLNCRRQDVWLSDTAETTDINCSTIHQIVSEDLGMRKVSARLVPTTENVNWRAEESQRWCLYWSSQSLASWTTKFSWQNSDTGWDVGPSLWSRDKTAKYDMEACHFSHPKE